MLHLEQTREVSVGAFGQIAEFAQLRFVGVPAKFCHDEGGISAHSAGRTNLLLERQLAGDAEILHGETVVAALSFGFPAASAAAVNHGIGVEGLTVGGLSGQD